MAADREEQEDELLALHNIFDSDEFFRDESKFAGEIRMSLELPADFTVVLKEGETLRQYDISFLPPLRLSFELPEDYPSSSPPSFTFICSWLTHKQLCALTAKLNDLYQATGGAVVLFTWIQFLKEDALKFLNIHSLLELPSHEQSIAQDLFATSSEAKHPTNSDNISYIERELELTPATSEFKVVSKSDQSNQEEILTGGNSSSLPSSSSPHPLDQTRQSELASPPVCSKKSPQTEHQTTSGLSLTPSQALLSQLLIYNANQKQKEFATTVFDCDICFVGWLGSECVQLLECGHIFCRGCLSEFCKLQITEGNVEGVTCPNADCPATPTPAQVKGLVGEELFSRYDRLLLQKTLDSMPDVVYCPRRTCAAAVILEKSSRAAMCSVCNFAFCVACRKNYHGTDDCGLKKNTKKQIKKPQHLNTSLPQSEEGLKALREDYASGSKRRKQLLESRYGRSRLLFTAEERLSEDWITANSKHCPHCFCRIEKNGGCNLMFCTKCRQRFCWACLTRLPKAVPHTHQCQSQLNEVLDSYD